MVRTNQRIVVVFVVVIVAWFADGRAGNLCTVDHSYKRTIIFILCESNHTDNIQNIEGI